ncbi:MAG: FdhF/YdeP family oxidoreductase [Pirellulales bacterium]|nr:FdhF/YdeP family oxidoreductase [Pirellulales bacterium]
MKKPKSGGGWQAIRYVLKKSRTSGGFLRMWKSLRSKNTCKTCAVGMGGQSGGMVNETGRSLEMCKKSVQAMAADLQEAGACEHLESHAISQLKKQTPYQLEHAGRLTHPMLYEKGRDFYRRIEWDEALERISTALKETSANDSFWYFSGRSSNEAGFLLQLFARLYGTNNVNNCSYYCHQASGVGLSSAIGSGTATVVLDDVEHADLVFVIGGNPPSNHPRLMTTLMQVKNNKGKVVVVNPAVEIGLVNFKVPSNPFSLLFGTPIADLYVQPHIGGDLAMLTGVAKAIKEMGAEDSVFLQSYCDGAEQWLDHLDAIPWDEITMKSGVSEGEIREMASLYAKAKNVIFCWTMGITHHTHGVQNVQAIANLAMMRGMLGRPHAGLLPVRGHSNVQGIGSVGVTPKLKDAIFNALESELNVELPTTEGLDTLGCMEATDRGELSLGFCLGGNLYGSNPDLEFAATSLSKLKTLVYINTTLNTGHAHGLADQTIILPVLARDEEAQPTTQESMFNFVRLSDGGPRRHDGPRSEIDVITDIAGKTLGTESPVNWQAMKEAPNIRSAIGKTIPGFEKIADIDETKSEFQIGGRTFHTPQFSTPNGKAQIHCHKLPELKGDETQLRLMTVRSEGQFNTVVYEETDIYRGIERRDVILINPTDTKRLGYRHDQKVTVKSPTGELQDIRIRNYDDIRAGNVLMYFPEANVLVPRTTDPQSRTPAFKGALVTLHAQ